MSRRIAIAAVLAGSLLAGSLLTGCTSDREPSAGAVPSQSPTATPTKDPLTGCVEQLDYWAKENLRRAPDEGYDYQHMALTADKYDELRQIIQAARPLQAKGKLPPTWIHDRSTEACRRVLAKPTPTGSVGGWPQ
ncbi:MAG TPA: hypothetical protein VFT31_04655 [Kribbella sp.]|nr:hypothetical protein [Kribbella sp.]